MKAELKKLVAREELDQVLEKLLAHLEERNPSLYNTGVNLSARYRQWKQKTLKGIQESQQEIHIIRDSLLQLIDQIDEIQSTSSSSGRSLSIVEKIQQGLGLASAEAALLFYHLGNTKFEWRKQVTLSEKTGWTAAEIDKIARFHPEQIKRGAREDGTIIFRLNPSWRKEVKQIIAADR
ncbi:MAG: hypothetical protein KTR30_20430 [Saprospiraceae bacterium]|nr:hypothetical protein [Saprospiraceae bacterium]